MTLPRSFAILLSGLLAVACQNKELTGIRGKVTAIHYVSWDQANDKPDTAFIRLDNDMEFRIAVHEHLPLQAGQQVLIQLPAQPQSLQRQIKPACAIIPLSDKGKALEALILRSGPYCG